MLAGHPRGLCRMVWAMAVVVVLYWAAKRQNLLLPMITGYKILPLGVRPPAQAGALRVLLFLGCGTLAAATLANFL